MSFIVKAGGLVLSGFGAWLIANKALNVARDISADRRKTAEWKAYYGCWSNGFKKPEGVPVPPGYSVSSTVDKGNSDSTEALVKAASSAVEASLQKMKDSLTRPSEKQEEAVEGQPEASESDISGTDKNTAEIDEPVYQESLENGVELADDDYKQPDLLGFNLPTEGWTLTLTKDGEEKKE